MEKENSWLRRARFSHTIYTRVGPRGVDVAPLGRDVEQKLLKFVSMGKSVSMPIDRDNEETKATLKHTASLPSIQSLLQVDKEKVNKQKVNLEIPLSPPSDSRKSKGPKGRSLVKSPSSMLLLSYLNKAHTIQGSSLQMADGSQQKARSKSPLPCVEPSEVFREARASGQRFTSPPPKRVGSEKSIYGKSFGRDVSDMFPSSDWCLTPVVADKYKSQKDSLWTRRYFDSGGKRRVSALDTMRGCRVSMAEAVQSTIDWTLDRSKLLVGHRFACGAYSQLYKGRRQWEDCCEA